MLQILNAITDPAANLTFLKALLDRLPTDKAPDAHVLLLSCIANSKLLYGDVEGAKTDMDAAWVVLDSLPSVEPSVRAAYYKLAADYYKAKAEYEPFYRNALLMLACVDLAELDPETRLVCAHDLSVAAFLGESIYNFGELVSGSMTLWVSLLLARNADPPRSSCTRSSTCSTTRRTRG